MENQNNESIWKKKINFSLGIPFKKILNAVVIILSVLILLFITFQIVENVRGRLAFERWKNEHKDVVLDIKHYFPPPVPDDKNLAMSGIFKVVADVYGKDKKDNTNAVNELTKFESESNEFTDKLRENSKEGVEIPISIFATNYINIKAVAETLRKINYKNCGSVSNDAECVLKAMSEINPYLDEILAESKRREFFRYPIYYDGKDPAAILLPHLSYIKKICEAIQLRAVCFMELNKGDAAFEDVRLGLRLAELLKDEPFIISQLVRVKVLNISLQNICEGMARGIWTEQQIAGFQNILSGINLLKDLRRSLETEQAFGAEMIMTIQDIEYFNKYFNPSYDDSSNSKIFTPFWFIPKGWFYQNAVNHCNFIEERKQILDNIIRDRRSSPMSAYYEKLSAKIKRSPYSILAGFLAIPMDKALYRVGASQTAAELCNIACAIERYRLAKDNLPEDLSKLTPDYLTVIPISLFDGKEFRYHKISESEYRLIAAIPDLAVPYSYEKQSNIPQLIEHEILFKRIK